MIKESHLKFIYALFFVSASFFATEAGATTGGCVNVNNVPTPTSASSAQFLYCQNTGYNGSVPCNADSACTWNPVLYHQNYCNGVNLISVFESNCPVGYSQTSYPAGVPLNPKFKCCKRAGESTPTATPKPSSTPNSGTGKCCNPAGNVVPSLVPCPTVNNPNQCCNPSGNPVPPMTGSINQCKGGLGIQPSHMKRK
jgi:hypothetical protein